MIIAIVISYYSLVQLIVFTTYIVQIDIPKVLDINVSTEYTGF